jgi:outer membrane receptor protein involved in Fe transport
MDHGPFYAHLDENTTESVFDPNLNNEYNAAYGVSVLHAPGAVSEWRDPDPTDIPDHRQAVRAVWRCDLQDGGCLETDGGTTRIAHRVQRRPRLLRPFLSPTSGPRRRSQPSGSSSENPITPKAVVAYQPDAGNLFYASAAKGYRPGGINGPLSSICGANLASIGLTAGPEIYAADSLWSYELGAKNSLLGGRMQINASAS